MTKFTCFIRMTIYNCWVCSKHRPTTATVLNSCFLPRYRRIMNVRSPVLYYPNHGKNPISICEYWHVTEQSAVSILPTQFHTFYPFPVHLIMEGPGHSWGVIAWTIQIGLLYAKRALILHLQKSARPFGTLRFLRPSPYASADPDFWKGGEYLFDGQTDFVWEWRTFRGS